MQLIDRYIYAVTETLPEDIREDIGKELRANIEDMLPDNPSEEDVFHVLEEMGNPKRLADEYNPKKRYLIGPSLYDKYITVLKMVLGICVTVFICLVLLTWALELPEEVYTADSITKLIVELINAGLQGILQGALWVTLVFAILERTGVEAGQLSLNNKNWTPNDLPTIPTDTTAKISRRETVVSIFGTIFLTSLLYFQPDMIAMYFTGDNGIKNVIPLFSKAGLNSFMPFILMLAIVQISFHIWKFVSGSWNIRLALGNAVFNLLSCTLLIIMISSNSLFNSDFASTMSDIMNTSQQAVSTWWNRGIFIFAITVVVICIVDSFTTFRKCKNR